MAGATRVALGLPRPPPKVVPRGSSQGLTAGPLPNSPLIGGFPEARAVARFFLRPLSGRLLGVYA